MLHKKIEKKVKDILGHGNIYEDMYHIEWGEDCFFIIITGKSEIFSDLIDELKDVFNNEIILISVDEGNIILHLDIGDVAPTLYKI